MKRIVLLCVGATLLWGQYALAATERLVGYGAVLYDQTQPDSDRYDASAIGQGQQLIEPNKGVRALIGFPLVDYVTLELTGRYGESDFERLSGVQDEQLQVGADIAFSPWQGPVSPYMLLGGGWMRNEVDEPGFQIERDAVYGNAGVGVWVRLFDGFFLRGEVRRVVSDGDFQFNGADTEHDERLADTEWGVGLQYMIIKRTEAPPPPPPPPPPPVDPCAFDDDGDGVNNCLDKCPDTPKGFKVDAQGCIEEKQTVIVLSRVLFDFDKSDLRPEARTILDGIANGLLKQPTVTVEIGGHACDLGTENYNLGLSKRRANSVRDFLIARGVAASRLTAEGYGEYHPLVPNVDEEHRQKNRRVEFKILSK